MKVAVLGFGTVGVGVYEMLAGAAGLEQGPVLVRPGKEDRPFKVSSLSAIVDDPEVGAVVEVMGGVEPAFSYACAALRAGKHFVTSNKALVAARGVELNRLAREQGVAFLFSAACGGAVPFLHNLALARESDAILSLGGILNGTTNYMLDAMQRLGLDYADVLADAQRLGYAEADPTADVSGLDALRKIRLAAAVAFGILPDGCLNEGIENVSVEDIRFYQSKGLVLRLIAKTVRTESGVSAYVEPVLFPQNAPEAAVSLNNNLASYEGRFCGRISFSGQGAGRWPTASAVIRDLENILSGARRMLPERTVSAAADNGGDNQRYYLRLPEAFAAFFPEAEPPEAGAADGELRLVTKRLSVAEMHGLAAEIRQKGGRISFAALEE